jgi:hypothetical protein
VKVLYPQLATIFGVMSIEPALPLAAMLAALPLIHQLIQVQPWADLISLAATAAIHPKN